MAWEKFKKIDYRLIECAKNWTTPFARFSIFLVYFWFGILKVASTSPANPLVSELLSKTLPFISFETFILLLGIFEMIIGIWFLIPKFSRLLMLLLLAHMATTIMPLILLPSVTWQSFLVPTLEGQYIIKNILIIALAIGIMSKLRPLDTLEDVENKGRL